MRIPLKGTGPTYALKRVSGVERIISGVCTSSRKDNESDILDADGANWKLPLPLLADHQVGIEIGSVTKLWREGEKIKFMASVASEDSWARIISNRKTGISIGFDPQTVEPLKGGRHRVKNFQIVEISLVEGQANDDARVERVEQRVMKSAAAPSRSDSARVYYYGKSAAVAKPKAPPVVNERADVSPEPNHTPYTAGVVADWGIKNLSKPAVPNDLRDSETRSKFLTESSEHCADVAAKIFAGQGFHPDAFVRAHDLATFTGILLARQQVGDARIAALERSVAEMEDNSTRFCGVHQRAIAYRRGSLVVHQGSLWAAISSAAQGEVPGASDHWQLATKRGCVDG